VGVLLRQNGGKWESIRRFEFDSESQLQKMLYDSPELIASEPDEVIVFTCEAGLPGSGYTDLLGVTGEGRILLVETKLARNAEIRRKVIGQVFEYAAYLWGMSFDHFDSFFKQKEHNSVIDLIQQKKSELDREQLKNGIASRLADGAFDLLIAVDEINPELEKIIAFLSSRKTAVRLEALEVEAYKHNNMELVVPHRHGQIDTSDPPTASTTLEQIVAESPDAHSRLLLTAVISEWQNLGHRLVPRTKGASGRASIGEYEETIFCVYAKTIEVWFGHLERKGAPADIILEYRKRLAGLPGFTSKFLKDDSPNVKWQVLDDKGVKSFVSAAQHFVDQWSQRRQFEPGDSKQD
jgi:hypothetical protein